MACVRKNTTLRSQMVKTCTEVFRKELKKKGPQVFTSNVRYTVTKNMTVTVKSTQSQVCFNCSVLKKIILQSELGYPSAGKARSVKLQ